MIIDILTPILIFQDEETNIIVGFGEILFSETAENTNRSTIPLIFFVSKVLNIPSLSVFYTQSVTATIMAVRSVSFISMLYLTGSCERRVAHLIVYGETGIFLLFLCT